MIYDPELTNSRYYYERKQTSKRCTLQMSEEEQVKEMVAEAEQILEDAGGVPPPPEEPSASAPPPEKPPEDVPPVPEPAQETAEEKPPEAEPVTEKTDETAAEPKAKPKKEYDPEKDDVYQRSIANLDLSRPGHKKFERRLYEERKKFWEDSQIYEEMEILDARDVFTKMPLQLQGKAIRLVAGFLTSLWILIAMNIKSWFPQLNDFWSAVIALVYGLVNTLFMMYFAQVERNAEKLEKSMSGKTVEERQRELIAKRAERYEKEREIALAIEADRLAREAMEAANKAGEVTTNATPAG
jgi:hypothetical protein